MSGYKSNWSFYSTVTKQYYPRITEEEAIEIENKRIEEYRKYVEEQRKNFNPDSIKNLPSWADDE